MTEPDSASAHKLANQAVWRYSPNRSPSGRNSGSLAAASGCIPILSQAHRPKETRMVSDFAFLGLRLATHPADFGPKSI